MISAREIISKLDLKPLPEEGGYYRETYRSTSRIPGTVLGLDPSDSRIVSTAIYYVVIPESFSALHRVKSDEIFHFYSGDPIEMIQIDVAGNLSKHTLGSDIFAGQCPQVLVPKGAWQGLRLISGGQWSFMGTTVAPGFEFQDFEVGQREILINQFPQHRDEIIKYTREPSEKAH